MVEIKVKMSNYEAEWLEQAVERSERGAHVDEGTLRTLGEILLNGVDL